MSKLKAVSLKLPIEVHTGLKIIGVKKGVNLAELMGKYIKEGVEKDSKKLEK